MKKIILFDLDGTLIDSTSAILDGFDAAFMAYNDTKPDHEKVKSLIGHTLDDMFVSLGVKKEDVAFIRSKYKEIYTQIYLPQTTLLPYAKEAIEQAAKFAKLGIVTTKGSASIPVLMRHLGVLKYFDAIVGLNDVVNPKPNAEPVNLALSRLNANDIQRQNAFMIGDTKFDCLAAKNAGIHALSVLCGYSSKKELKEYNDKIFANTLEAVKFAKNF
ncbi:HAD family hydrolase [Campylobacter sp. 9BO]|uniref:HAD family hydrolase n=1 Tax=Campylobacter sp. 9BO TaxID=3424759 RepID=UPI003D334766